MMPVEQVSTASVWQAGNWYITQVLETDVASQGESVENALTNPREALALHLELSTPTIMPQVHSSRVEIGAT